MIGSASSSNLARESAIWRCLGPDVSAVMKGRLMSVEVPVESRYFEDASSVGFRQGVVYGLGTLWTALRFVLHRAGLARSDKFRR